MKTGGVSPTRISRATTSTDRIDFPVPPPAFAREGRAGDFDIAVGGQLPARSLRPAISSHVRSTQA